MYLGLDLSIDQTGYAFVDDKKVVDVGEIKADKHMFYTTEERKQYTIDTIFAKIKKYKPTHIAIERVVIQRNESTISLIELRGVILHKLFNYAGNPFTMDISAGTMLKYAIGKGAVNKSDVEKYAATSKAKYKAKARIAKKKMTIEAAEIMFGVQLNSDDAADALCIAMMLKHFITNKHTQEVKPELHAKQEEAISTIRETQDEKESKLSEHYDKVDKKRAKINKP